MSFQRQQKDHHYTFNDPTRTMGTVSMDTNLTRMMH